MRSLRFVYHSLHQSEQDYWKSNEPIALKLDVMIGPINRKNGLTFDGDPVLDMDFGSLFHFPHHWGIGDITRFISIFSCSYWRIFMKLGEVTDADKRMHPQYFGSDLAGIWIQINPKTQIRILDHFWLRFCPWQRFALSEYSSCFLCNYL